MASLHVDSILPFQLSEEYLPSEVGYLLVSYRNFSSPILGVSTVPS